MIASSSHLSGKSPQRYLFIFWCFACGSASSGSVVVDEDGLVGGGVDVVVVGGRDVEVVDGGGGAGGLDGLDLDGGAVGGVEGVSGVEPAGGDVAAAVGVYGVGGGGGDGTAGGGEAQGGHVVVDEDLWAVGGGAGPRAPRAERDFGVSSGSDIVGGGPAPTSPTDEVKGASTFASPEEAGKRLRGWAHRLPAGSELPEGVSVHVDGGDVDGYAAWGHRTIYPNSGDDVGRVPQEVRVIGLAEGCQA